MLYFYIMNEKVLRVSEYYKIINMLEEQATSDPGRKRCRELLPLKKMAEIERAQEETQTALNYLLRLGSISFGSNRDFTDVFRALTIESSLSPAELLRLASFLENVDRVGRYAKELEDEKENVLSDLFSCLIPLPSLAKEIRRCILAEDEMADDASPALRSIRRDMLSTIDRIHAQLQKMVNVTASSYLQDAVITMRNDRYCLPVKSEYKTQVPGMVHDQSSSGSTLFIEPAAIVEMNNHLRELAVEEKNEIEAILARLSEEAGASLIVLKDDAANMTALDFIFARASLALKQNATRPVFNNEHRIRICRGRHPLIDPKKVVPVDIALGGSVPSDDSVPGAPEMIIITGPNTGGKTVTLKTTGLLELMGMAGLHIPAADKSELSIFREIFADIGDEQSIEQSLSTFSSHMVSIVDILKRCDRDCLCLFDELGAGTDPAEGAALAIAILNFLHIRGITSMATTHYSELKLYAMQTEGVANASCEFNVETLQPTYRLLVGIPGKSNAFAISRKLGLPGYIIDAAQQQLSAEARDFESVLGELDEARRKADDLQQQLDRKTTELARREKHLREREQALEQKKEAVLQKANEQARDILQEAKTEADQVISDMRRQGRSQDMASLERSRTALREKLSAKDKTLQKKAETVPGKPLAAEDIHLGDTVLISSMGMTGTVTALPDRQARVKIRCGNMNTTVPLKELRSAKASSLPKPAPAPKTTMNLSRAVSISPELNLLGMTVDEAISELDKYLDDARLSHLDSVRIVHGKGTGALRKAVGAYLRKQSGLKYRGGDFGEGDAGVTIVTF